MAALPCPPEDWPRFSNRALGRFAEARGLADRAAKAADTQDAPGTAQPARAHALLTRLSTAP